MLLSQLLSTKQESPNALSAVVALMIGLIGICICAACTLAVLQYKESKDAVTKARFDIQGRPTQSTAAVVS